MAEKVSVTARHSILECQTSKALACAWDSYTNKKELAYFRWSVLSVVTIRSVVPQLQRYFTIIGPALTSSFPLVLAIDLALGNILLW